MIDVINLKVSFLGVEVLHDVSLSVKEGEIVAIVGMNGAGKSTLIKAITGIVKPLSGRITFNGNDITGHQPHLITKRGLAQVPERRRLFAGMTVMENLLVAMTNSGARVNRDHSLAKVFRLFPILQQRCKQRAGTLSGGEQQMLAISRGLMALPKLLIMDEPSLGLAPLLVQEVWNVISRFNIEENLTVLLAEQNLAGALKISHRGYVLEKGSIVLEGIGKELLLDAHTRQAYLGLERDVNQF